MTGNTAQAVKNEILHMQILRKNILQTERQGEVILHDVLLQKKLREGEETMTFKIERFRTPTGSFEHDIDLDDVIEQFECDDILRQLAKDTDNFAEVIFEFIDSYFVGGFDAFVEKFKEKE